MKRNYCGASPFANGPDDGCEIKDVQKPRTGVEVIADYRCEWNERKGEAQCKQSGQPPASVRDLLVGELRKLGLPANAPGQTYFTLWRSAHSGWILAQAYYSHPVGSDVQLCEVIGVIGPASRLVVLRKLPFKRTDADVPNVTQWAPVDIADAEGDGSEEVVLEGDAYEDHWLEVVKVSDGTVQTIFSGLGYYL